MYSLSIVRKLSPLKSVCGICSRIQVDLCFCYKAMDLKDIVIKKVKGEACI